MQINGTALQRVDSFAHHGSIVTKSCSLDRKIYHRIAKASVAFGRLYKRVFANRDLRIRLKVAVYRAVVVSTPLYVSQTWALYGF